MLVHCQSIVCSVCHPGQGTPSPSTVLPSEYRDDPGTKPPSACSPHNTSGLFCCISGVDFLMSSNGQLWSRCPTTRKIDPMSLPQTYTWSPTAQSLNAIKQCKGESLVHESFTDTSPKQTKQPTPYAPGQCLVPLEMFQYKCNFS